MLVKKLLPVFVAVSVLGGFIFSGVGNAQPAAKDKDDLVLNFGAYTVEKPQAIVDGHKPLLNYLMQQMSKELGRPVRIQFRVFQSYDAGRKALVTDYVDLMSLGAASFVLAKEENPKIQLLAIEEESGKPFFKGIMFVRTGSAIKSLGDIKGKSFAFGDPDSTVGRYLSQSALVDAGLIATDLSNYEYLGRQDKIVEAVLAKQFDAGAARDKNFSDAKSRGLTEIFSFETPTRPWVARGGMPPETFKILKKLLIGLHDKTILQGVNPKMTGFSEGSDKAYDGIKIAMKKSEKFGAKETPAAAAN